MTMITPSYLGETIEYSSLHACRSTLEDPTAPMTAELTRRIADLPELVKLAAKARRDYGGAYCGGQIEVSLRKVTGGRKAS